MPWDTQWATVLQGGAFSGRSSSLINRTKEGNLSLGSL